MRTLTLILVFLASLFQASADPIPYPASPYSRTLFVLTNQAAWDAALGVGGGGGSSTNSFGNITNSVFGGIQTNFSAPANVYYPLFSNRLDAASMSGMCEIDITNITPPQTLFFEYAAVPGGPPGSVAVRLYPSTFAYSLRATWDGADFVRFDFQKNGSIPITNAIVKLFASSGTAFAVQTLPVTTLGNDLALVPSAINFNFYGGDVNVGNVNVNNLYATNSIKQSNPDDGTMVELKNGGLYLGGNPTIDSNGNAMLAAIFGVSVTAQSFTGNASGLTNLLGSGMTNITHTNYTLDFPSTAAGTRQPLTGTIAGLGTNKNYNIIIQPAFPILAISTNNSYDGAVTATNTLTIYEHNLNLVNAIDPISGRYDVTIIWYP